MASGVKVILNLRGVREVLNDDGVIADLEKRGGAIAERATENALGHYDDLGYRSGQEIFVSKTTKTAKYGNAEVIVFANPGIHAGEDGAPIGDYAQARHSSLTQAMDAGRG